MPMRKRRRKSRALKDIRSAGRQLALAKTKTKATWKRYKIKQGPGDRITIQSTSGRVGSVPKSTKISRISSKGWSIARI